MLLIKNLKADVKDVWFSNATTMGDLIYQIAGYMFNKRDRKRKTWNIINTKSAFRFSGGGGSLKHRMEKFSNNIRNFSLLYPKPACINIILQKKVIMQHGRLGFDPWVGKIPWRREWLPTPVLLPGEIPCTEEPGGLQSTGSPRVRYDWVT